MKSNLIYEILTVLSYNFDYCIAYINKVKMLKCLNFFSSQRYYKGLDYQGSTVFKCFKTDPNLPYGSLWGRVENSAFKFIVDKIWVRGVAVGLGFLSYSVRLHLYILHRWSTLPCNIKVFELVFFYKSTGL